MIHHSGQTDNVDGSGGQSLGSRSVGNLDGGNTMSECENPKVSASTCSDSLSPSLLSSLIQFYSQSLILFLFLPLPFPIPFALN